jgi:hypothetical protein
VFVFVGGTNVVVVVVVESISVEIDVVVVSVVVVVVVVVLVVVKDGTVVVVVVVVLVVLIATVVPVLLVVVVVVVEVLVVVVDEVTVFCVVETGRVTRQLHALLTTLGGKSALVRSCKSCESVSLLVAALALTVCTRSEMLTVSVVSLSVEVDLLKMINSDFAKR